ncbi:secretin and TonB N-terminal domain-containing protein [Undibacterium parvum]|uniref:General secretion pathway protein GspD n=2 Tax=Undibacterium TaxID=401469 RepID=A0A6M4A6U4_9BURK|nr:secretin and TonB N-terminal domain-containing protein [Undibacterium parvum]AZP12385.1 general secretion pathway protein GspD [Undibacterium parvum]QJQ06658.1 general secretion pathway protein GspD [Undibacterium piscinae]
MLSQTQKYRSSDALLFRLLKSFALPLLLLSLTGCAAQIAYRDAKKLVAEDQIEAGLVKYREAMRADPYNAEYRIAYLRIRDKNVLQLLEQGEALLKEGNNEAARNSFNQALALDAASERARNDLRSLEINMRQEKQIAAASTALEMKENETARQILNAVLAESPGNQKARSLLASIAESPKAASAESGIAKQFKKPISIQFKDTPLRQVFDVIARTSGLNFVFDKDVKADQKATISLKNSSIELAVYYLLMSNQLEQQIVDANTIMIYPNSAAKLKEYQEMVVKTFFIANADAKLVANTLKTILKSKDIVVDEKLNLVILRDTRESIRLAEKLVALQDIPEAEVMLEVEILEVKTNRLTELGVAWPASLALSPLTAGNGVGFTIADLRNLNQNNIGITPPSVTINANTKDGDANTLANPRIRVRNREKAKVHIGEKLPSVTTTVSPGAAGFASESVSYIDVGLTLNVEPTIYLNNEVAIRVDLEVSNLLGTMTTKSGTVGYQIGTRKATTVLQLKDGENQVLAGLISNEDRSNGNKVPGVGDLPLLGRLFGSTKDDTQKTEIVLSITPRLIRNIRRPEANSSEFSAGTDANFRNRPDAVARAPAIVAPAKVEPVATPVLIPVWPAATEVGTEPVVKQEK